MKNTNSFIGLSWDDLREWAGSKIVSRGRSYQRQNLVSELAVLDDGSLIAWVDGTDKYITQVVIGKKGLPESTCTCPYSFNCKHGVAVVLEYLEQIKKNKQIPKANKDDERLSIFDSKKWDNDLYEDNNKSPSMAKTKPEIEVFITGRTKEQLAELIYELAGKFPQVAHELSDNCQIASGDIKLLIKGIKKDIHEISSKPGWQNHWEPEGYTPDYSNVRIKLETLLKAGFADKVVTIGKELIELGTKQLEESDDEGETAAEIADCMPVIINSLKQSSMENADKLLWAVDVVLKDDYGICDAFRKYLWDHHETKDWNILTDKLLEQLNKMDVNKKNDFHQNYARDRLADWIIHSMEKAERKKEIIPLCETEASETGSYSRLVQYLISAKRYADAECWIGKGIKATDKQWPGVASDLRNKLKEIRIFQKDWASIAIMQIEEFVSNPSKKTFLECQEANNKTKTWLLVRECLLVYLETGILPCNPKDWPFGKHSQTFQQQSSYRNQFPMIDILIDIAILEKKPQQVLLWYDQLQKDKYGWARLKNNEIAHAIQNFAPERAVLIWKRMTESLINQAKPNAYEQAVSCLRKIEKTLKYLKKQTEWDRYLHELKEKHIRKRRLIEILNQSDNQPIISKK